MKNHAIRLLATLLAFLSPCQSGRAAEAAFAESHVRGGLPNFFAKLEAGKPVTVAFLGGSITEQAWYVRKFVGALEKVYPHSPVTVVNAGVAGMPSAVGVFRVGETVMAAKPDLVLVEFAVNDGDNPSSHPLICEAMEGIVSQVWKADPLADICFVYNARGGATGVDVLQSGQFPQGATAHERVAEHYGIPSVHMTLFAAGQIKDGKLAWAPTKAAESTAQQDKSIEESNRKTMAGEAPATPPPAPAAALPLFTVDGVHPNELGGQLSAEAIMRGFALFKGGGAKPGPHEIKPPLTANTLEHAVMLAPSSATMSAGWTKPDMNTDEQLRKWKRAAVQLWKAGAAGETVGFAFKGTEISLMAVGGPDEGRIEISLDGVPRTLPLSSSYTEQKKKPSVIYLTIGKGLPDALHTVALKTLNPCSIGYFLIVGDIVPSEKINPQTTGH
jgi:lysophospholipase L1-like esterase